MHEGRASSHFLCLLLHVRQPVFTFALLTRVRFGFPPLVSLGALNAVDVLFSSGEVDLDFDEALAALVETLGDIEYAVCTHTRIPETKIRNGVYARRLIM